MEDPGDADFDVGEDGQLPLGDVLRPAVAAFGFDWSLGVLLPEGDSLPHLPGFWVHGDAGGVNHHPNPIFDADLDDVGVNGKIVPKCRLLPRLGAVQVGDVPDVGGEVIDLVHSLEGLSGESRILQVPHHDLRLGTEVGEVISTPRRKVAYHDSGLPCVEQPLGYMAPEESCPASDSYPHLDSRPPEREGGGLVGPSGSSLALPFHGPHPQTVLRDFGVPLVVSAFVLVKEETGDGFLASVAAVLTAVSTQELVGITAGLLANWLALPFANFFFALLRRSMRTRRLVFAVPCFAIFSAFLFIHPWTLAR